MLPFWSIKKPRDSRLLFSKIIFSCLCCLGSGIPIRFSMLRGRAQHPGTILKIRYMAVNPFAMQAVFKSEISSAIFPKLSERS